MKCAVFKLKTLTFTMNLTLTTENANPWNGTVQCFWTKIVPISTAVSSTIGLGCCFLSAIFQSPLKGENFTKCR